VTIREQILNTFSELLREESVGQIELKDDLELLGTGLDSLGLAVLVVRLEAQLGYDPFTISETPMYPRTVGELINFYEVTDSSSKNKN
jgi:acyl carrier protein